MLVAPCVSLWLFYIFGTRQGTFKYVRCFKNEKYTSWNCPLLWPWGAACDVGCGGPGLAAYPGSNDLCRGMTKNGSDVFPPGAGVGGMWQEGGNSCLPRAWVSIKQVFSGGQGPVLVPPAVARSCPWRCAGPKENSQQRKGPLWRAEDGCWTRGRLPELCGQGGGRQVLPPGHPCLLEKECTTWKLQIQFYSGVLLRTIAWETASASSEELLQRDKGGARKKLWSNVKSSQRTDISS